MTALCNPKPLPMKTTLRLGLLLGAVTALWTGCQQPAPGNVYSDRFEQAKFREPENAFRAVPFYSLNDSLDATELRRQLHIFKDAGYGGAFLHSRIGLLTPYLADAWFDMMRVGTETLQQLGMDAWYYDEDKWPSGFAGGIVPRMNPDFQARCLLRIARTQPVEAPDTVLFEDADYKYIARVDPMGQPWYNGTSWVDLMNPEMVQAFINCSFKPYTDIFQGQPHAMGIFSDEPQISALDRGYPNEGKASYSPVMEKIFREKWGYALNPVLPSLFDTVGDWRKVRLDYYRTLAYCMEQAFSKPVGDYCAAHDFIWTGHYNAEDNPVGNMLNEGNLMQQLRHMQQPGIDALGLRYNSVHCGKTASSVGNQYGLRRRLSELFGISGHNMSFEDRMWITSWHTLMGINFMCPHLYLYSMKGSRKRDFPPTISHQQPYWSQNKLFEDYSARLCYFASTGRTRAEVCVLNPIESDYIEPTIEAARQRDDGYERLLRRLMGAHINFDMGDEQIISEIAAVRDGRFVVGEMAYPVVLLPDMITIRASTLRLLDEFHRAGGTVMVCGDYPTLVDAAPDPAAIAALKAYAPRIAEEALASALRPETRPLFTLSGPEADSIWSHMREMEGGTALQLSNTSRTGTFRVEVRYADASQPVALWNPVNGQVLDIRPADGAYTLEFAPAQTWILTTGQPSAQAQPDGAYRLPGARTDVLALTGDWNGRRLDPNAVTLDFASFSKDGGRSWSAPEPVLAFYSRTAVSEPYDGPLQLKYRIDVDELPAACSLAMEQPRMYESIAVNGRKVEFTDDGFYVDASFRTRDITPLLKKGANDIVLSLNYVSAVPDSYDAVERYGSEIESIYLVGDFGVRGTSAGEPLADTWRNRQKGLKAAPAVNRFASFALAGEPARVSGDLTLQGYPFYAGSYELSRSFELPEVKAGERYLLSFPGFEAILIGVKVNGKPLPVLFSSPWEADLTDALRPGENEVTLTLTNGLRNLMGPHHHMGGEFSEVGPATFSGSDDWPNIMPGDPDWYDARLRGKTRLWRDTYHMIPFGILQPPVLQSEKDS